MADEHKHMDLETARRLSIPEGAFVCPPTSIGRMFVLLAAVDGSGPEFDPWFALVPRNPGD